MSDDHFKRQNELLERQNGLLEALIRKQDAQKKVVEKMAKMICYQTFGEGYNKKHLQELITELQV